MGNILLAVIVFILQLNPIPVSMSLPKLRSDRASWNDCLLVQQMYNKAKLRKWCPAFTVCKMLIWQVCWLVSLGYIWCQKCFLRCPSVKDARSITEIGCQLGFFVARLSGLVSTPQTCNKSILIKTSTHRTLSRHQNHTWQHILLKSF